MAGELSQQLVKESIYVGAAFPYTYTGLHGLREGNSEYSLEYKHQTLFSVAGTLTHLHVKLNSAPESGNKLIFRVWKNGAYTDLDVTIEDDETEGTDDSATIAVEPGDVFYLKSYRIGSPGMKYASISLVFFPTNIFETNLICNGSQFSTNINSGWSSGSPMLGADNAGWAFGLIIPIACVLSNLRVKRLGSGSARTYTVLKDGVATDLSVTLASGESDASDLVNTISCAVGDRVNIYRTDGGYEEVIFSMKRTDTGYMSFVLGGAPHDWNSEPGTTERVFGGTGGTRDKVMMNECVFRSLYVVLRRAPGAGASRTVKLTKNGVATDLSVTISGTDTTGNDAHWVYFDKGDIARVSCSKTGSPPAYMLDVVYGFDILSTVDLLVPTVETYPCTDRTATSAKAHGHITAVGGYYVITRGFAYKKGTTGDPNIDDDSVESENGEFLTGAYSLDITGLDSGEPYRVRAFATGPKGTGYGATITCSVVVIDPSGTRVSAIRRIFRPGLYRMELALGDLGFEWDVAEVAMRKTEEGVAEPEEEKPSEPPTKEEIEKARQRFQEESWPKAVESLELMFPERPPVSGKYTPPAPRPRITYTNPVTGELLKPSTTDKPTPKPFIPFISPTEEDKE